jgi:hypothetical protein
MLSNNLLIPYGFIGSLKHSSPEKNSKRILNSRKIGIFYSLFWLMPSIKFCFRIHIGFHWLGIFCNNCAISTSFWCIILEERIKNGAAAGIIIGFSICCYTLLAPIGITKSTSLFIQEGPWKLHYLNHFNFSG